MIVNIIDYLRDRQKTLIRWCYVILALLVISNVFVDKSKAHIWLETIPGFWSLFGFIACVLIIILSKWFGSLGIMTREDYYDN